MVKKEKNSRIIKTKVKNIIFLEEEYVTNGVQNIRDLKKIIKNSEEIISKDISIKTMINEKNIDACNNRIEKIIENLSEVISLWPSFK